MYRDLRSDYWWPGMKRDVARHVEACMTCLRVKAEHQKPHGRMQPLEVPEWKWENITMDLITKLPKTPRKFDAIWVIVDQLTKSAHFLAIRESSTAEQLAEIYVKEVVSRHEVPVSIISDRDVRFTSRFWERFHSELGTRLHFSTAYHPQTDGQSERTIQTLEDMLRACVLDFGGCWDTYLPLAEFSYNNSYHSSIGMPPYEMLYGRRCRTPICWGEVGQRVLGSTEVVQRTTEDIQRIRERLRTAQSRQKSYADRRRSDLEFQVGDRVLLKVSPWKGVIRFRKRGKLGPRFIRPFTVLARVGKVAYRLELPAVLGQIHNTFHVSQLRKCLADETAHIPLDDIKVDESLNYVERPVAVIDRKVKRLRSKEIGLVKRIFRYLKGTPNLGLWYPRDSGFDLTTFSDSDFAGCKIDLKSTTGGCQLLGGKLVSWTSKKQNFVSTSTAEVEYVADGSCCAQVLWMRNQLQDYGFQPSKIPIYYDNTSAIAIANNPVLHSKTKHIEIQYHFIRDHAMNGDVELHFVPTEYQLADLFTKPLDEKRFDQLISELGMLNPDV
ncbi:hypothetical protein OSB04_007228 [Centaurea solstitialis]|uniref:Integrase catalytic domain-containing protein n=1 Tax=Centaurea solstitialis TaxID=347529 RepID=A0AA38TS42_9ASTR|nr:hypothetical protein OSB04_007228 [Centaurea solstitialis]